MTTLKLEHHGRIADIRRTLADAIGRARYGDESVVMTGYGKPAAVIVSVDFYRRALESLNETRVPTQWKP